MHREAGKGSKRRPGDQGAYNASWERVFGKAIWIEDGDLGSGWSCPICHQKYIDGRLPKDCEVLTCPGK